MPKKLYIYAHKNIHGLVELTQTEPDDMTGYVRTHVSRDFISLFRRVGNYNSYDFHVLPLDAIPETDEKRRLQMTLEELLQDSHT
jgi:hypothetical protein